MLPYLVVKKVKAEDVIRFLPLYPAMNGRFSQKNDLDTAALRADRGAGMSYEAIAAKYGVSLSAVYWRLEPAKCRQYRDKYRGKNKAAVASAA